MFQNLFPKTSQRMRLFLLMLFMALVLVLVYFAMRPSPPPVEKVEVPPMKTTIASDEVIDFNTLDQNGNSETMAERKNRYGITDSVDMVVTSDESIRVGDETLNMRDFEEKDALRKGDIVVQPLDGSDQKNPTQDYGIHVVISGDNIWAIHFRLLKESLASRDIVLPADADRPNVEGYSSGVGKVLKFSERMVRIYSMKDKNFVENINILQPLDKIVIYNMEEMNGLLDSMTRENVNHIRFDGETLWISAK